MDTIVIVSSVVISAAYLLWQFLDRGLLDDS